MVLDSLFEFSDYMYDCAVVFANCSYWSVSSTGRLFRTLDGGWSHDKWFSHIIKVVTKRGFNRDFHRGMLVLTDIYTHTLINDE